MPIVSISKIQHRYGLSENLPQLSAAEFGWVIDQRRLFIGNGPTSEGAPAVGNTEILTQYSNILDTAGNAYIYKDKAVGFDAITGTSNLDPTTRSLQEKLDDFVNVRDYGALGNNVNDDTDAINRALYDLYCRENNNIQVRRTLYFPAGTYRISSPILIPAFATLQGEGRNCTILKATDDGAVCVARLADSKQQVGAAMGTNNANFPQYIVVNDITFSSNQLEIDTFIIESTNHASFNRVGFTGAKTVAPDAASPFASAVSIYSTAINQSYNIFFNDCEFTGTNFGMILDDDMQNIVMNSCSFSKLYRSIKIGENTLGTGASIVGPRGVRVTNSLFDQIFSIAIQTYTAGQITSAYNIFKDVGNQLINLPTDPVLSFGNDGNSSIHDIFYRTDIQDLTAPRVYFSDKKTIYMSPLHGVQIGYRQLAPGGAVVLQDNTPSATSTGITFSTDQKSQIIHYIAERDLNVRQGTLRLTATDSGVTLSDDFTDDAADIGLIFTASVVGSVVTIKYTTTNTGNGIGFKYSVDRMVI